MAATSKNNMEMGANKVLECTIELVPCRLKEESHSSQGCQRICRVCLATDVKLYLLRNELLKQYQDITGLKPSNEDNLPQYLCWECSQRLTNCHRFKSRAVLAHCLLTGLLEADKTVTESNITKIDRRKNGLESVLLKNTEPPHLVHVERLNDVVIGNKINDNIILVVQNSDSKPTVGGTNTINLEHKIKKEKVELVLETDSDDNLNRHDDYDLDCNNVKDLDTSDDELDTKRYIEIPVTPIKEARPRRRVSTRTTKAPLRQKASTAKKVTKKSPQKPKVEPKEETKKFVKRVIKRPRKIKSDIDNPEKFEVINLSFEEQVEMVEKRKESDNYKHSPFKCDKCYKGFLDEQAFKLHMIRHTNEVGEYECPVCKIHFKSNHRLNNHAVMHCHKFACKQCPFVTMGRHSAQVHVKFHQGIMYKCPHCPEQFAKATSYLSHLRIKHPSNIVCDLCGYSFVSQKGLIQHKKLKHRFDEPEPAQEQHTCEVCQVVVATDAALKTHMEVSHAAGNSDRANTSQGKLRRSKSEMARGRLMRYKKVHKGPIQCEQCDAELPDAMSYHQHFRWNHRGVNRTSFPATQPQFMCEVCGRMLQSRSLLIDHSFVHSNVKQFQCSICDKTFQRKNRLVEHVRRHNTKPSHRCVECGKNFSSRGNMMRHAFIHTGLKPFKCEHCGKCFTHDAERGLHIQYVHLKKPWPKRNRGKRAKPYQESEPLPNMEIQQPWGGCSNP